MNKPIIIKLEKITKMGDSVQLSFKLDGLSSHCAAYFSMAADDISVTVVASIALVSMLTWGAEILRDDVITQQSFTITIVPSRDSSHVTGGILR
jgi:hypothetical protein